MRRRAAAAAMILAVAPHAARAQDSDRRRPGEPEALPERRAVEENKGAVEAPPPEAFPADHIPIPDRWRLADAIGVKDNPRDPYHQNRLKGDRPIRGTEDWFIALSGISDTVVEPRSFPVPVGNQTSSKPGRIDTFGRSNSVVASQTIIAGAALIKGSTAFKPPELEVRLTLAANLNHADIGERRVLSVKPSKPTHRTDQFLGVQEAFVDYHLRNTSSRYDFDSIRVGIQPFSSDFRGFIFQDNQLGVRLFGNRDNNRIQYNIAAFARLEKDTNSGLNDVTQNVRKDYVIATNLYRQDFPFVGLTSEFTTLYNRNRERGSVHVDDNGFPARPALIGNLKSRDYDIVYVGYNADGHIGRMNLTASAFTAFGQDRNSVFTGKKAKVNAWFAAAEPSYDFSWLRVRGSALYASGDGDPYDNHERGFDAIFENPQFAGADTSYWIRQSVPFAGGGRAVFLNGRNGILNSLRSSKEEGQSNFNNPGTILLGAGADADLTPRFRLSANLNHLWVAKTAVMKALRSEGSIPRQLGWDGSMAVTFRPKMIQNVVVRGSVAAFQPEKGFSDLFENRGRDKRYYSVLLNAALSY